LKKIEIDENNSYYLKIITTISLLIILSGILYLIIYESFIGIILIIYGILGIIIELYILVFVKEIDLDKDLEKLEKLYELYKKFKKQENESRNI